MRLTHRTNDKKILRYLPNHKKTRQQINNKLGQLEDIEEELGIDLITLFKANLEGVCLKGFGGKFPVMIRVGEITHSVTLHTYTTYPEKIMLKVEDYGKTWALTKEELL